MVHNGGVMPNKALESDAPDAAPLCHAAAAARGSRFALGIQDTAHEN